MLRGIPARLHFCWIGSTLPWAYVFALLSAVERSGLADITLHHADALADDATTRVLRGTSGLRLSRLDPEGLLREAGERLRLGDGLMALHGRLADPVQRSDVLRAAILFVEGGIYADLDTVTVGPLGPLLGTKAFVGSEFIVWPQAARRSRSPIRLARPIAGDLMRKLLRAHPAGWRAFRRVERLYVRGVNNAVMGAEPGAALMAAYLRAMVALPPARQTAPYGLGPHLLQEVVAQSGRGDVEVHDPAVFHPLPPEISEHWFRRRRSVDLDAVLPAATRLVHWYASVRTRVRVASISPAFIAGNRDRQLYSALVCAMVPQAARLARETSTAFPHAR